MIYFVFNISSVHRKDNIKWKSRLIFFTYYFWVECILIYDFVLNIVIEVLCHPGHGIDFKCHRQLDFQFDQLKGVCSLCGSVLTDILYELWNESKHNVRGFCNRVKVEHLWIVWHKSSALLLLVSKLEKQADKRSVYVRMQSDLVLWKLQLLTASQTQPTQRDWSY